MVCRFSRIADTLLQRWSNVFLQDIGHFVTSIYSSIAKLISASTSDFHGSISPLGGDFRNLVRSASDCLRGGFRAFASSFRNGASTFAGSFHNGASAFSCPLCDSIRTFRSRLCNVVAPILQEFSRIGRSGANLLERIESHSPCLLQRERAEAAAVRVICPFVF